MRGQVNPQSDMLCLLSPASRVPQHHPLRQVKVLVDEDAGPQAEQFLELVREMVSRGAKGASVNPLPEVEALGRVANG